MSCSTISRNVNRDPRGHLVEIRADASDTELASTHSRIRHNPVVRESLIRIDQAMLSNGLNVNHEKLSNHIN